MLKKLVLSVFLLHVYLALACKSAESSEFKVVFLNPGHPEVNSTGKFWGNVSRFMHAAAKDLDIELVTIYACRNHILMKSLVDKIVEQDPKYVVVVNEKGVALNIIKQLARKNIASFMLLNNLTDKDYALLDADEKALLIGSVIPNNYRVGKRLLNEMVAQYQENYKGILQESPLKVLALQGDYTTPASLERTRGFTDALKAHNNIIVVDSTVANWSKEQAYSKVKGILKHAHIDLIWSANDAMAFGAKKAVLQSDSVHEMIIGGVNWDVEDPLYPVNISYGGHVTLGAKALTMLKDIDANTLPVDNRHQVIDIFTSSLSPNYHHFTDRLKRNDLDKYDFSKFSLTLKGNTEFSIESLNQSYN